MYVKRICTHIIKIRDKSYSVFFLFIIFPGQNIGVILGLFQPPLITVALTYST